MCLFNMPDIKTKSFCSPTLTIWRKGSNSEHNDIEEQKIHRIRMVYEQDMAHEIPELVGA